MNQEQKTRQRQVLFIDSSPLYEGFFKEKLVAEQIKVTMAKGDRDAFQKMISQLPDLILVDIESDFENIQNFLENKLHDPNTARIPMIISGPQIPKEQVANLIRFGVMKYFAKPLKFDTFFKAIGKVLRTSLTIDETECALETHINGNMIFIEISKGLNRDKISLLRYRLSELLDINPLHEPKIVVMMSNLELTFVDGANLELLFDILCDEKRIKRSNIKVLAINDFIKELIAGHPMYSGIEVVENLNDILGQFVDTSSITPDDFSEVVTEKILNVDGEAKDSSVELRFGADCPEQEEQEAFDGSSLEIAIVDPNVEIQQSISQAFTAIKSKTQIFGNGQSLMQALANKSFSLIILDLYLPDVNGFQLLQYFKQQKLSIPILVHSVAPSKQFVVQALQFGASGFVIKPQPPAAVVQKALEIIKNRQIMELLKKPL